MAAKSDRPNVIVILTDDMSYGDIHCYGNTLVKTPNIDQFSQEALLMSNFHVSPTSAPSRAALTTGRSSNRVGVWHTVGGRSLLFEDETTLAELFKGAGYSTV